MGDRVPYVVTIVMKGGVVKHFPIRAKNRANARHQLTETKEFKEWLKTINEEDIDGVSVGIDMDRYRTAPR